MTEAVAGILSENSPSVYLYGSAASGDFRLGCSDIDILVLTREPITAAQAEMLLRLRQTLTQGEPGNPYYRLFEGGILSLSAFLSGAPDTVVYWGTSGERIAQKYEFNSFSREELFTNGVLLFGEDVRAQIPRPTYEDLRVEVQKHLASVRAYGGTTGESLFSFGWLLDISRCIYTLRTGRVIAKTAAGEWALANGLCPDPAALQTAVRLRYEPERFQKEPELRTYAASLGDTVRQYADVLQTELETTMEPYEIKRLSLADYPACAARCGGSCSFAETCLGQRRAGTREAWGLYVNGEIVSECHLVYDTPEYDTVPGRRVYLSRMGTRKEYRRKGYGFAIAQFVIGLAKERGYKEIALGVNCDNAAALSLYDKLGFAVYETAEDDYGRFYRMEKKL